MSCDSRLGEQGASWEWQPGVASTRLLGGIVSGTELYWKVTAGIAAVCALTVTTIVAKRELFPGKAIARRVAAMPPVAVGGWDTLVARGHRLGTGRGNVEIIEFADFECPACRMFHQSALAGVRKKYPDDLVVIFRHFPLDYHRFAMPAARAAECAADQGRFEAMHDLLYAQQDSLGLKSFAEYAKQAGVQDVGAFEGCVKGTSKDQVISADRATAIGLKAAGTPTILIQGRLYSSVPDSMKLDSIVQALKGR